MRKKKKKFDEFMSMKTSVTLIGIYPGVLNLQPFPSKVVVIISSFLYCNTTKNLLIFDPYFIIDDDDNNDGK